MDMEEKKRLANERRLKAVQEWMKNKTKQHVAETFQTNFEPKVEKQSKLTLFNSDDENNSDEEINFKTRPQYKGDHGQYFLSLNSENQGDFKIDDRFTTVSNVGRSEASKKDSNEVVPKVDSSDEDNDTESSASATEDAEEIKIRSDQIKEKTKNLEILTKVLGRDIGGISTEKPTLKKNIVRFDPEDENASKYLKTVEQTGKVSRSKFQNKSENEFKEEDGKRVSPEKYVEVDPNLKSLLNSNEAPFSFSKKFGSSENPDTFDDFLPKKQDNSEEVVAKEIRVEKMHHGRNQFTERRNYSFFIGENHPYLKQGVEFWKTSKTIDEKNEEWSNKKGSVMMQFRKKRKSAQRRFSKKMNASERNKMYTKK